MVKNIAPDQIGVLRSKDQELSHAHKVPKKKRKKELCTEYGLQDTYNTLTKLNLDMYLKACSFITNTQSRYINILAWVDQRH